MPPNLGFIPGISTRNLAAPIRLLIPTAAGGLMDVAARIAADYLGKAMGQRLVIENALEPGNYGVVVSNALATGRLRVMRRERSTRDMTPPSGTLQMPRLSS